MKTNLFVTITFLLMVSIGTLSAQKRTINVSGSATMDVIPDEIILKINLEEYWEEQYMPNKTQDQFVTKVELGLIEKKFFETLDKVKISRDSVLMESIGKIRLWDNNKSVQYKVYKISVATFEKADKILFELDFHGIASANVAELKNKKLTQYRQDVKKEAMLAAKNKAEYLLNVINEQLGVVISINEVNTESDTYYSGSGKSSFLSNTHMGSTGNVENMDLYRYIPLRYNINATFEIKKKE
jgi:uncharacterized protein